MAARPRRGRPAPVPMSARLARATAIVLSSLAGMGATALFLQFGAVDGLQEIDLLRGALILISTLWLAWARQAA